VTLVKSACSTLRYGVSAAALLTAMAVQAHAQDATPAAVAEAARADETAAQQASAAAALQDQQASKPAAQADPGQGNEIVVTGTLFRDSNATSISPVTMLTAETLERANITTAQAAIRSV